MQARVVVLSGCRRVDEDLAGARVVVVARLGPVVVVPPPCTTTIGVAVAVEVVRNNGCTGWRIVQIQRRRLVEIGGDRRGLVGELECLDADDEVGAFITQRIAVGIHQRVAVGVDEVVRRAVVGDRVVGLGTGDQSPRELLTVQPSYADETARQQADVARMNAETSRAAAGTTLSPNQIRYDINGNPIAENTNETPAQEAARQARSEAEAKNRASADANLQMVGNARSAVSRARDQVGFFSAGTLTSGLPFNQSRANLEATLDTIRANLSFAELAKMRANSPTGGALGSIAVRELDLLGSTVASLNADQSQEELNNSLRTIDSSLAKLEWAIQQSRQSGGSQGQSGGPVRVSSVAEARRLPRGTEFIDPNGVRRRVP